LSPSAASTFRQCARRWKLRYVDRLPDPPGEPALVGTFVHRVLEELFVADPQGRSVERAKALARDVWPEIEADDGFVALELDEEASRGFRWRAWRSIEGYFAIEDPTAVEVVEREQMVECDLGGVPFVGVVDRVERVGGHLVVADYKTGRPPAARFAADRLSQVFLYAAAIAELGERPAQVRLLYLGAKVLAAQATDAELTQVVDQLSETWDAIGAALSADDFAPRTGPLCGWCPYVAECPEGQAELERRLGPAA
jgi:putative RecB family exonuclease